MLVTNQFYENHDKHHVEAHLVIVVKEAAVGEQEASLVNDGTKKYRTRNGTYEPGIKEIEIKKLMCIGT